MPDTGWLGAAESTYGSGWDTFDLNTDTGVGPEFTAFLRYADLVVARRTVPATSSWDTVVTAGGFGASLPAGATVDGVEIRILQGPIGLPISDVLEIEAKLVSGAESGAAQTADAVGGWTEIESATEYLIWGSSTNLLGTDVDFVWADATVELRYRNSTGSPVQVGIDHVQIKIHYTEEAAAFGFWAGCFM